jgi:hypothetical protein
LLGDNAITPTLNTPTVITPTLNTPTVITPTLNTPTVITPTLITPFCWAALKSFKNNSAAYEKNFRLRDKNHAPFKLNGQSRTAFGLLKAPEFTKHNKYVVNQKLKHFDDFSCREHFVRG